MISSACGDKHSMPICEVGTSMGLSKFNQLNGELKKPGDNGELLNGLKSPYVSLDIQRMVEVLNYTPTLLL